MSGREGSAEVDMEIEVFARRERVMKGSGPYPKVTGLNWSHQSSTLQRTNSDLDRTFKNSRHQSPVCFCSSQVVNSYSLTIVSPTLFHKVLLSSDTLRAPVLHASSPSPTTPTSCSPSCLFVRPQFSTSRYIRFYS